ncbi:MAG: hypothetical protein KDC10_01775 [Calditrichaeota bacterium]|nr:hypothetical protein [Candidatus Cloacimonadota bacterium]MCA9785811.1 hypothetical protein [Candidatus Cloacimonadota bacterium]MCB1045903.1 hypothetical protein [Calditrichota bacterium]MCB9474727.1 hypothetical protein [Candidatus Delongbacteria bacterium]
MAKASKKPDKDSEPDGLNPGKGGKPGDENPAGDESAKAEGKGKRKTTLLIVAGFLLSMAIVNTGMFFYFRNVRSQVTVPLAQVQEELVADTVAVVDSLLQDSLSIVVDELVDHVLEKNEEVAILKDSTEALTTRLQQLQAELGTMDDRKVDLKDQDLERLSRVFGSMQPAKAAPVMLKMDNAAVAGILLSIEERTAAKILAAMPPEKAAEIARLIRERATLKQAGQRR